jgi:glyoxylase-like metal-dependent hydrolase (beta-lactamase superfamily II)
MHSPHIIMKISRFVFNPFEVNTFVLHDETGCCIIIDPGCINQNEVGKIVSFIESSRLHPEYIVLTHGHIDHILGVKFICENYNIKPYIHSSDQFLIDSSQNIAKMYGLPYIKSEVEFMFLDTMQYLSFGTSSLKLMHCPGHSPGSVCLYSESDKILISGDVLFNGSIGRTDLPGGEYSQLIESIERKLLVLPEDTIVFPGHYEETSIGKEKKSNPFLR